MPGPTLRIVDGDVAPEEIQRELEWAVRRHPAGRAVPDVADLRARLAAAEADAARHASLRGRVRARAADAITRAGAAVYTAARALAERVAP